MTRPSKDIAKRLRFDHRPRPDLFRRWYAIAGVSACVLAAAAWLVFARTVGERQYLPGPLTPAHSTFGDRCAHCHVSFGSAPDEKCIACHRPGVHSPFEVATPPCRECHTEHRGEDLLLTLTAQRCVSCHRDLDSRRAVEVATAIASFADHPEFTPRREGARDEAALRFNHQLHLTSDNVTEEELTCASCHVLSVDGRYMRPILFEPHCERCHALKVTEGVPAPMSEIAAPHEDPAAIRTALTDALLALGARRPSEIFAADNSVLLPGRAARGPIDESASLQEFQRKYLARFEEALYRPFADAVPLLENNKHCFLCHLQGESVDAGDLPTVVETKVPARWLARGEFSHRKHDRLACDTCHPGVEKSQLTSEVNLPARAVCAQCHSDAAAQSAGTECMLCHLYHEAGKDPSKRPAAPTLRLDELLGRDS